MLRCFRVRVVPSWQHGLYGILVVACRLVGGCGALLDAFLLDLLQAFKPLLFP